MEKEILKIGEAAKLLGVTPRTLRNWDASGKLPARRTKTGRRYYLRDEIIRFSEDLPALGFAWATNTQTPQIPTRYYCETQDRFTSRLNKMAIEFMSHNEIEVTEDTLSLLLQAVGEIGDNSFAHNIGKWPNTPGLFFAYNIHKRIIVLADRGVGVFSTLSRILPDIETDTQALEIAFTRRISGRDPEKRGNGLKVVRRVAESDAIGLRYYSGIGAVTIPQPTSHMTISIGTHNVPGTYAVITF